MDSLERKYGVLIAAYETLQRHNGVQLADIARLINPSCLSTGVASLLLEARREELYRPREAILGSDFITPEAVQKALPDMRYYAEQLATLEETLPSEAALAWCRDHDTFVFPGPPQAWSFLDIQALFPAFFTKKVGVGSWTCPALAEPGVETAWYAIRKSLLPYSLDTTEPEAKELFLGPEARMDYIPPLATMAWALALYRLIRRRDFLVGEYGRTSTHTTAGEVIYLGIPPYEGAEIDVEWCHPGKTVPNLGTFVGHSLVRPELM